jgi:hypothetical protein
VSEQPTTPETGNSDDFEDVCGETYDHTESDLGEGHWVCTNCGAEGWDTEGDENG